MSETSRPRKRSAGASGGSFSVHADPLRSAVALSANQSEVCELARRICDLAIESSGAGSAMLFVRDGASYDLQLLYSSASPADIQARKVELVSGKAADRAISSPVPILVTPDDARAALSPAPGIDAPVFVFSPLICAGVSHGLMVLGFGDQQAARSSLDALLELSTVAAAWLGRHYAVELATRRPRNLDAAMQSIAQLGPPATPSEVRQAIVKAASALLGTKLVALFTIDPCMGGVECEGTAEVGESVRSAFWELFGKWATDRTHEGVWVVRDVRTEAVGLERAAGDLVEFGIRSILACPLRSNVGASGVLVAFHSCRMREPESQSKLLSAIAAVATALISYGFAVEQSTCLLDDLAGANQELSLQAAQDGLTGLPNHRAFQQRLAEMCRRSTTSRRPFSLVMIDVDHFKFYNDSHGHQEGDAALRDVAQVVSTGLRQDDFAARYGGEEFALALCDTTKDNALAVAERIRQAVADYPFPRGHMTISLGVAEFLSDASTPNEIIELADRALYHAKITGRNRVVPWGGMAYVQAGESPSVSSARKRVLIVEPECGEPGARLRDMLAAGPYLVEDCQDTELAMEMLRTGLFDIALFSEIGPEADYRSISTMVAMHPCMPVVLVSREVSIETSREALRNGAADVLARPDEAAELPIMIERNIERARVEKQRLTQTSTGVMLQAIEALVAAIDAKDPHTAGHSKSVTAIAIAIADHLDLTDEDRYALDLAARLHDIGKLALPDSALNKQSPLTQDEWQAMRQHPAVGSKIVGAIDELSYVSNIIRHHHERLDGTGYPDGLCDKAIPYLAKVIAVADAYEAMTAERAYRSPLTPAEAVEELWLHAHVYYDAEIVEVLAKHVASVDDSVTDRRRAA